MNEAILKFVKMIMGVDSSKSINIDEEFLTFSNPELENVSEGEYEKVAISYMGIDFWQLDNITREEGYQLDPNASSPLPFEISEKLYVEAMEYFKSIEGTEKGVNLVIVKRPEDEMYRVARLQITDDPWAF